VGGGGPKTHKPQSPFDKNSFTKKQTNIYLNNFSFIDKE
jgi:hypothetical protein